MDAAKLHANFRSWNKQHAVLRRLLLKDKNYEEAVPVFLKQHGMVHAGGVDRGAHWTFADEILSGLTSDEMRVIPKSFPHSVIWSLWHIARIEDATMNVLLADSPQVLFSGDWGAKLGTRNVGVGNELDSREIAQLSRSINPSALLAYRRAVGLRTRALIRRLDLAILDVRPAPARLRRLVTQKAVYDSTTWLLDYWGRNPAANLLLMPASRHSLVHLNEISRMIPKLKRRAI